ncbi:hypothetical protein BZA77DRAFT_346883 [Pyronema omphalodes]|nr:hypothetical protein BZA77DRAFT_346883 [Pyronema omphalodes]
MLLYLSIFCFTLSTASAQGVRMMGVNTIQPNRTPFAVSTNGQTGYLASMQSNTSASIQQLAIANFSGTAPVIQLPGVTELSSIVAHTNGFTVMLHTISGDILLRRFINGKEQWNTTLGRSLSPGGGMVFSEKTGLYGVYFGVAAPGGNGTDIKMLAVHYDGVNGKGDITEVLMDPFSAASSQSAPKCVVNTGIVTASNGSFVSSCLDINNGLWMGDTVIAEKTVPGDVKGNFNKLARFPGDGELFVMAYLVGAGNGSSAGLLSGSLGGGTPMASSGRCLDDSSTGGSSMISSGTSVDSSANSSAALVPANVGVSLLSPANSLHISTLLTSTSLSASVSETNLNPRVCPITPTQALVTYETISNGRFLGTNLQILSASGERIGRARLMKGMRISGDIVSIRGNGQSAKLCWPYFLVPSGTSDAAEPKVQFMCAVLGGGNSNNPPNIPPIKSGEPPATGSGRSAEPTAIPTPTTKVNSTPITTTKATPTSVTEKTTVISSSTKATAIATVTVTRSFVFVTKTSRRRVTVTRSTVRLPSNLPPTLSVSSPAKTVSKTPPTSIITSAPELTTSIVVAPGRRFVHVSSLLKSGRKDVRVTRTVTVTGRS